MSHKMRNESLYNNAIFAATIVHTFHTLLLLSLKTLVITREKKDFLILLQLQLQATHTTFNTFTLHNPTRTPPLP